MSLIKSLPAGGLVTQDGAPIGSAALLGAEELVLSGEEKVHADVYLTVAGIHTMPSIGTWYPWEGTFGVGDLAGFTHDGSGLLTLEDETTRVFTASYSGYHRTSVASISSFGLSINGDIPEPHTVRTTRLAATPSAFSFTVNIVIEPGDTIRPVSSSGGTPTMYYDLFSGFSISE
jgi:hypothetical protein